MVLDYIEQRWSVDESFSREEIYRSEAYFAHYYPDNRHIRTKLGQVLRTLAANGEIEVLGPGMYRRINPIR